MYKMIIAMVLVPLFLGCSQDPLTGVPERVRNGVPVDDKPVEKLDPIDRNLFVIEMDERSDINFTETVTKSIGFDVRILQKDAPAFEVEVENLPVNAVFDAVENTLTWTPSEGYVSEGSLYKQVGLTVVVRTTSEPFMVLKKDINLFVHRRSVTKPEIRNASYIRGRVMEGETSIFTFQVFDKFTNQGHPPEIKILGFKGNQDYDGASLVRISRVKQTTTDPHLWDVEAYIDTRNLQMKKGSKYYSMAIAAVSRFGIASDVKEYNFRVYRKVKPPVVTVDGSKYEIVRGQQNLVISFDAFPTHNSDYIYIKFLDDCSKMKGTVSCSCPGSYLRSAKCQVVVSPGNVSKYRFNLETKVYNQDLGKSSAITGKHFFEVKVNDPVVIQPPQGEQ